MFISPSFFLDALQKIENSAFLYSENMPKVTAQKMKISIKGIFQ